MTLESDYVIWQESVEDYLAKKRQAEFSARIERHGGIEGWHQFCRNRRRANPDYRLAVVIGRLVDKGGEPGEWRLNQWDLATLEADIELSAYFLSVAEVGRDAWMDERRRIRAVQNEAWAANTEAARMLALSRYAIMSLLPVWRAWGRILSHVH